MNIRLNKLTIATMALAIFAVPASADVIQTFTLTLSACSTSCGPGPYATITLDQVNSTTVLVTEILSAGENYAGTNSGDSLEFNLSGVTGTTTLTNIPSDFHQDIAPPSASAFGSFGFGVDCNLVKNVCKGGAGTLTTVSFDVVNSNGISISNFTANTSGYYFATDVSVSGVTGNTATNVAGVFNTPEPATFALLGLGLCGIGLSMRRFSRK
jgi:hypothetical protein